MTDAAARYQSLDGQAQVSQNLVYNATSGNWELEEQAFTDVITGNLYLLLDDVETLLTAIQASADDQLSDYKFSGYVVSGTAVYIGYEDKSGAYYVQYIETSTGVVTYAVGTGGVPIPGNYSGLSFGSFASKF